MEVHQEQGEEPQAGDEDVQVTVRKEAGEWVSRVVSQVVGKPVEMTLGDVALGDDLPKRFSFNINVERWSDIQPYYSPVYHYTSYESLLSITKSRSLRATKISHLNDATESHIGREVVLEAVERFRVKDRSLARKIIEVVSQGFSGSSMYVLCGSKIAEDLTQFDRYGEVCIELPGHPVNLSYAGADTRLFHQIFKSGIPYGWFEVMYDRKTQLNVATKMLRRMVDSSRDHGHTVRHPPFAGELCVNVMIHWYSLFVGLCKHPNYAKEEEVRYIELINPQSPIEHRISPTLGVTPFITLRAIESPVPGLPTPRVDETAAPLLLPIKSLRLAYAQYPELAIEGAKSLLKHEGYPPVDVQVVMEHYRPSRH